MIRVALVLEGPSDVLAFPALVTKTAAMSGLDVIAPNPIRAGNFQKLEQPNQLERFARMAASRPDANLVLIAVDLDDGCHVEKQAQFLARLAPIEAEFQKPIRVCFCVREYECWFLECLDHLKAAAAEYDWIDGNLITNPHAIRGAKEALQRCMRRHYKETTDQLALTRRLDLKGLFAKNRGFRKFAKAVTGLTYGELALLFA